MQTAHSVAGAMNDADFITTHFDALGAPEWAPNAALQNISRQSSAGTPQRILRTVSRFYEGSVALRTREHARSSSKIYRATFTSGVSRPAPVRRRGVIRCVKSVR